MEGIHEHQGSVVGGALLLTGCCVGAGMLGLPILTGMAGFIPTILMLIIACFFMTTTGLLVVEINQWFEGRANYITMVSKLLGPIGRLLCWFFYLFLFYSLLVAYTAASGHHVSTLFCQSIPSWLGSLFFVVLFGWFIYLGTRAVDHVNRVLMAFKIITFLALIGIGFAFIDGQKLLHVEMEYAFFPLPILVISFGFQNMIPTLSHYMLGDTKRIKQAIILGSVVTLCIYILWISIALGILPIKGDHGIIHSYHAGIDAAQAMRMYLQNPWIGGFAAALAFFAILTSFLAQSLSIVHFLSDGMKIAVKKRENVWICLLALVPPLIFATINPSIFYQALNFAGGVCAVVLFGILPVLMIIRGRKDRDRPGSYQVSGGMPLLGILSFIALFILFYQLSNMFGFDLFPHP